MNVTVPMAENFIAFQCYTCSIWFYVPVQTYERFRRNKNNSIYCPNGHGTITGTANPDYVHKISTPSQIIIEAKIPAPVISSPDPLPPVKKPPADSWSSRKGKPCLVCGKRVKGMKLHMDRMHPEATK